MDKIVTLVKKLCKDINNIKDIKYDGSKIHFIYRNFPMSLEYIYSTHHASIEYSLFFPDYGIEYLTYYSSLRDHKKEFIRLYQELMMLKPNRSHIEDLIYLK